jgi:hypothetical protein
MPTRCNRCFLLQILLLAQHVSGHHYAHHQELESIIPKTTGGNQLYNTLELLMMGIMGLLHQPANRTHNPQLHTIPTT